MRETERERERERENGLSCRRRKHERWTRIVNFVDDGGLEFGAAAIREQTSPKSAGVSDADAAFDDRPGVSWVPAGATVATR